MNARNTMKPSDLIKRLENEGWTRRKGRGDHVNFKKAGHKMITVDTGAKEVPIGTLRATFRIAGWEW